MQRLTWLIALIGAIGCNKVDEYAPAPLPATPAPAASQPDANVAPPSSEPAKPAAAVTPAADFRLDRRNSTYRGVRGYELVPQARVEGQWCGQFSDNRSGCFTMPDNDDNTADSYMDLPTASQLVQLAADQLAAIPPRPSLRGVASVCAVEEGECYSPATHICGAVDKHKLDEGEAGKCVRASQRCCPEDDELVEKPKPVPPAKAAADADDAASADQEAADEPASRRDESWAPPTPAFTPASPPAPRPGRPVNIQANPAAK